MLSISKVAQRSSSTKNVKTHGSNKRYVLMTWQKDKKIDTRIHSYIILQITYDISWYN